MALIDNLVAYWSLDEASGSAIDAHGANDLAETSGTIGATTGKVAGCRDFEAGDTEYLGIADNADLSVGNIDFTFACWVNLETTSGLDRSIFGKGGATALPYNLDVSGGAFFRFRVSSGVSFANITSVTASNLGVPSAGVWYFVIAWHDSVNNQLGICVNDGTPNTAAYSAGSYDDAGEFHLGAFPSFGNHFDGLIDEVGFWKGRVLTSGERTDLYNSGSGRNYAYINGGGLLRRSRLPLLGVG